MNSIIKRRKNMKPLYPEKALSNPTAWITSAISAALARVAN
jgi:hypothetical protein